MMARFTPPVICSHGLAVEISTSAGTSRMFPARTSTFIGAPRGVRRVTNSEAAPAACRPGRFPKLLRVSASCYETQHLRLMDKVPDGLQPRLGHRGDACHQDDDDGRHD